MEGGGPGMRCRLINELFEAVVLGWDCAMLEFEPRLELLEAVHMGVNSMIEKQ